MIRRLLVIVVVFGILSSFCSGGTERLNVDPLRKVYIIETMHANAEAGRGVYEIIDKLRVEDPNLTRDGQLNIFVEGTDGKIDVGFAAKISDGKIKNELVEFALDHGYITAGEYYGLRNPELVNIVGVEDYELYKKDFERLMDSFSNQERANRIIRKIENVIEFGKEILYSDMLKEFEEKERKYIEGDRGLRAHLELIKAEETKLKSYGSPDRWVLGQRRVDKGSGWQDLAVSESLRDLGNPHYPNLSLIQRMYELGEGIDFGFVEREKRTLVKQLGLKDMGLGDVKEIVTTQNIRLPEGNLRKYFRYLDYKEKLDEGALLREINLATDRLKKNMIRGEDTEGLYISDKYIKLLKRYLNAEITYHEFNRFKALRKDFYDKGTKVLSKLVEKNSFFRELRKLEIMEDTAREFYTLADKRSEVMIANMLSYRKLPAILITGGYHTKRITDILHAKGIDYEILRPEIEEKYNKKIYLERLKEQKRHFDSQMREV